MYSLLMGVVDGALGGQNDDAIEIWVLLLQKAIHKIKPFLSGKWLIGR